MAILSSREKTVEILAAPSAVKKKMDVNLNHLDDRTRRYTEDSKTDSHDAFLDSGNPTTEIILRLW